MQEYLLVSQDRINVEQHFRQGEVWRRKSFQNVDEIVLLNSIECILKLNEIYLRTDLV